MQSPEMREMVWALELAAAKEMSREEAYQVWLKVKGRSMESVRENVGTFDRLRGSLTRGLREVAASLVQESLLPSLAVRGATSAQPKLLVYETDEFAISVSFSGPPEATRLKLIGQVAPKVSPEIPSGGKIALWSDSETFFAEVNEHGEFSVDNVPRGDLHMDILLGDDCIQLSPIHTRTPVA